VITLEKEFQFRVSRVEDFTAYNGLKGSITLEMRRQIYKPSFQ
jgi:hypothetical protein